MFYPARNDLDLQNPNLGLLRAQGYYFLPITDGSCTVIASQGAQVWRILAYLFTLDLCWHYTYVDSDLKRLYKFSFVAPEGQSVEALRDNLHNKLRDDLALCPPSSLPVRMRQNAA